MLYVKHITKKSKEKFYRIQDDSVYVFCERCGKMIYILEPGGFLYEYGGCSDTIEDIDLCDECYDRKCRIEDDYLITIALLKGIQLSSIIRINRIK